MGMHRALCTICPQVVATERRGLIYVVTPVCQFHRIHGQLAAMPWLGITDFFIHQFWLYCFRRPEFLFKGASVLADACAAGDASSEGEFCRTEFGVRGPWLAGPGLRLLFWYIQDQRTGEHVFTCKPITPSLVQSGAGEVLHQGVVRSYVIQRGGPFNVRTNVTTRMHSNIILEGPWPPVSLGAGLTNAPGSLSAETKHPFCRCCHEQAHVYLQAHIFEVLFESSF